LLQGKELTTKRVRGVEEEGAALDNPEKVG